MADARSHAGEFENPDGAESITDVASLSSIIPRTSHGKGGKTCTGLPVNQSFQITKKGRT
jgi:hypothetical protein